MADGKVWWIPSDSDEKTIRALIERKADKSFTMPGRLVGVHPQDKPRKSVTVELWESLKEE
jgi:hypothetical protein